METLEGDILSSSYDSTPYDLDKTCIQVFSKKYEAIHTSIQPLDVPVTDFLKICEAQQGQFEKDIFFNKKFLYPENYR